MPQKSKTLKEIQKIVDGWINQFEEGYWPPLAQLAGLVEEVGEVARVVNESEGAKPRKKDEEKKELGIELADVLFKIAALANQYGVDLEKSFEKKLKTVDKRDAHRWTKKNK